VLAYLIHIGEIKMSGHTNYRNFYNKYAEKIDNFKSIHHSDYYIMQLLVGQYDQKLFSILSQIVKDKMVIVDIGCGSAYYLDFISNHYNVKLIGLEISDIEICRAKKTIAKDDILLIQHDLSLGLPFENESVDIIFNSSVLEHLECPEYIIRESHRVLKKNGKIIGRTPNKYSLMEICSAILSKSGLRDMLNKPDPGHISLFTEKTLSDCLTEFHFRIDYMDVSGLYVPGFRLLNYRIFTPLFRLSNKCSCYTKPINWAILYCATKN
jgi:SAM-dependent methyltransferase